MSDFEENEIGESTQQNLSYFSDLFVGLSFVFLFLYIIAAFQSGLNEISHNMELKEQLKAQEEMFKLRMKETEEKLSYLHGQLNQSENSYIENYASTQEKKLYEQVVKKIHLLRDDYKKEIVNNDNKRKEFELKIENLKKNNDALTTLNKDLNKYQYMVRSFVSTNFHWKNKSVEDRNDAVRAQDQLEQLKVTNKKRLDAKDRRFDNYKKKVAKEIKSMQSKHKQELDQKTNDINFLSNVIDKKKVVAEKLDKELAQLEKESKELVAKLKETNKQQVSKLKKSTKAQVSKLKKLNEAQVAKLQKENDAKLNELQKLKSDIEKRSSEIAALEKERSELSSEKSNILSKLDSKDRELERLANNLQEGSRSIASLEENLKKSEGQNKELKDLVKTKGNGDAKRYVVTQEIVKRLQDSFSKKGYSVDINSTTGELTLNSDIFYYNLDQYLLNDRKQARLKEIIPVYAEALFGDAKLANYIKSIEITGYSSPTYAGKYVDPTALSEESQEALDYNLALSYRRARSIFRYIFNPKKYFNYNYQDIMFKKTKITSRSYLESIPFAPGDTDRKLASEMTSEEFCKAYDCKKHQKVIIKFLIKDIK